MKQIIDVSYWQGNIDWAKAAPELEFAILRASCGTAKDQKVDEYVKGCRKYGVPFGVYHFLMATNTVRAKDEADRFYNSAKDHKPNFWVVDVEHPPLVWADGKGLPMNPALYNIVKTFVARLRQRAGDDAKILYYGGESVYSPAYGNLGRIPWDGLWIASYGKNNGKVSSTPKMEHDLHQYTSVGKIPGIRTNVDLNRLMGDKPLSWWTGQTEPEPEENPAPTIPDDPAATPEHEEPDVEKPVVDANGDGLIVRVTEPYSWNVRSGDGTSYEPLMVAYQGYEFEYVGVSVTGWIALRLSDGRIGWITPKAAQVVKL